MVRFLTAKNYFLTDNPVSLNSLAFVDHSSDLDLKINSPEQRTKEELLRRLPRRQTPASRFYRLSSFTFNVNNITCSKVKLAARRSRVDNLAGILEVRVVPDFV